MNDRDARLRQMLGEMVSTWNAMNAVMERLEKFLQELGEPEEKLERGVWTDSRGRTWYLEDEKSFHTTDGQEWHWAGGYQGTDQDAYEPLFSRDDWSVVDVPLSELEERYGRLTGACDAYTYFNPPVEHCTMCGWPAWEHKGQAVASEGPFRDKVRVFQPWDGYMRELHEHWARGGNVRVKVPENDRGSYFLIKE